MLCIFYVEDNEDNGYMLKMRLKLTNEFEVLVAENGEKGCERRRPAFRTPAITI